MISGRKIWLGLVKKMKFLPQKYYVKCYYEYYSDKKLDFENPVEFNQKLSWYKVFYRPEILSVLVDKFAVRKYVEEKIGAEYLNECYGVYNKVSQINLKELPNQFVVKGVHGSNFNIVVKDKKKINKAKSYYKLIKWLNKNQYYRSGMEWAYKDVKPRFLIEKFMVDDKTKDLIDYKFYCFDGVPKFLVAQSDTLGRYFYDLNWAELPFKWENEYSNKIEKPTNFEELIKLSKKLSEGFPFVRVDFYSVNGKSIFGEMTFYPTGARDDFYPEKYNKIVGDYFKLPKIPKGKEYITIKN